VAFPGVDMELGLNLRSLVCPWSFLQSLATPIDRCSGSLFLCFFFFFSSVLGMNPGPGTH
jgi:hypothetical protein